MKKQKSIKFNFIMNAILNMSSFIFPLITFPYVSRVLSPVGYGKVSFASSVVSYFVILAQLGIPTYGIRACAKVRDDKIKLAKTVREILIISLVMCILAYASFGAALAMVPRFREDKLLFLVISSSILFNTIGVEWLYKALEQYTYITMRSIIFKMVALVAMFVMVREQGDYVIYGGISIFAAAASNLLNFLYLPRIIQGRPKEKYEFVRHLSPIMIFFAMSCATTIYIHMDSVMLGFMKTDADVGYYNVAIKIKMILVSVVTSLGTVLLPRVSYYIEYDMKEEFIKITKKALNFVLLISLPLMLYFMIYAKEGIFFLAGSAYEESILPMIVIMMTLPLIGMTNIMGIQILVPQGREKDVLYSELTGAVVDLILNFILIPRFSSTGAALGTLAAEAGVWCVQFGALRKTVGPAYKSIHYMAIFVALLSGSIVSISVKFLPLSDFATLLLSAMIFFGVYGIVLTIFKEPLVCELEKQIARRFMKTKKSDC